jgi:hypothetical protein
MPTSNMPPSNSKMQVIEPAKLAASQRASSMPLETITDPSVPPANGRCIFMEIYSTFAT